jgi:hypothetical protein
MNFNIFRRRGNDGDGDEPQAERPHFIISGDLNVTLILNGQTHSIGQSHPNHQAILDAIKAKEWSRLNDLVDIPQAMERYSEGQVVVNEFGEVFFGDEPVHSTVAQRITLFFQQGLDFKPLVRFMENLAANPSFRAREELYTFLENEGMPITEDGCFIGYKAIRNDYRDIHSGKFDNSVGAVHEMARNLVDDDARKACSNGFHIGSQAYAASFGGHDARMMLVKVNPADAVSVPYDGGEKLRACRYEVVAEVDKSTILQEPMYASQSVEDDCGYDDPWFDNEDDEDYPW